MDRDRHQKIEALFHAATTQPESRRSAFVDHACANDAGLRQEVQTLLAADNTPDNVLDTPACETALESHIQRTIQSGQHVGAYTIVRLIGSGGMGNVYEAIQNQPRRTVALKLLRSSLASDSELRRFQYESELLGCLRHPNIAQVYEAGIHEEGPVRVPYFAMELITHSSNLVDFAKTGRLSTEQRLELFIKVCDAVQHGHQKGIVHRDLKPANILVDPTGAPKIIDYGVARAADADLPLTTMRSSVEALVGTLQYMSPEQLAVDHGDVDTRSDVYALGLILYELLSETRPYDLNGKRLSDAIRTVELIPAPSIASVRRDLRGDLSTITAKAMAKDRSRRYQSPGELAADLRRYSCHEPIEARRPNVLYRLRKFTARNRSLAAGCIFAGIALASGAVLAGWQFRNATQERDRAHVEARKAERISAFLQNTLASADPRSSSADVSIREALNRAAETIEAELVDEPKVYADVHATIGSIYERLKLYENAEHHLRAALETRRKLFGDQSCEVAGTLSDLAWPVGRRNPEEQEGLVREALSIYRNLYGDQHPQTATHMTLLASCMVTRSDFTAAEAMAREALASLLKAHGTENGDTAFAKKILAESLHGQRRMPEAEEAFREALAVHRQVYGSDHYELALMLRGVARFLSQRNKRQEAETLEVEASRIFEKRVGEDPL